MILSDFHTHTTYSDGKHTPEQMVLGALSLGLSEIGFSDHAAHDFDYTMNKKDIAVYRNEIAELADKYKGQIDILCGIELDADAYDTAEGYDYAIASVHDVSVGGQNYCVDLSAKETLRAVNEGFGGSFDSYAEAYFEKLTDFVIRSGANIVGHFDLITKFSEIGVTYDPSSPRYVAAFRSALSELHNRAVFEVNTGAISRGYRTSPYPSLPILKEIFALGGKVVLSGDSHSKDTLCAHFDAAEKLLRECGFTEAGFTDRHGKYHKQIG
jgi:histidinol-phosphatase (PHP family)